MSIVTLTMNPSVDTTTRVHQVRPDSKLRCQPPRREPGGGGVNVARAVRKLGGEASAMLLLGGAEGRVLRDLLEAEEVPLRVHEFDGQTRESITVTEETSDQQYRFVMPGPQVPERVWRECLEALEETAEDAEYIVASGSLPRGVPEDFYARVARIGREGGARVVVDTKGEPLRRAVAEGLFLIKPNLRELDELTERELRREEDLDDIAGDLFQEGSVDAVVVSLGAGGAFLIADGRREHLRAPTVPIQSKVGAGDSMVAGIVLQLSEGRELREAVRYGVAAGAAAVQTPGSELCRREDTDSLYEEMGSA